MQLDNANRAGNESQVEKSLTVRIYYFPSDRYEYAIEVLEMQETLEELFDLKLGVKDRYLNVDELTTFMNDGVLNCSFDMEFSTARDLEWVTEDQKDFLDKHPTELMEELDFEKE